MGEADERWQRLYDEANRRRALKERAVAHLGGKCLICTYDRCPAALEFHHVEPDHKDFAISGRMSWPAVEAELSKCILVCSNCHREIHAGYHPRWIVLEDAEVGSFGSAYDDELPDRAAV